MKQAYVLALAALLLPNLVIAQFSISGKITDQTNKQPLAGASVSIGNKATQTNDEGEFTFTDLDKRLYSLKASFLGFSEVSKSIRLNADVRVNISLQRAGIVTDEVIIRATRANTNSATTYRNIGKDELEKNNFGQDLPYLLNQTPSVVVTSDAGTGIGYTGIRIRGSDATRTNVTLNGIPFNDPESQGSFFVNIPDLASSIDNMQIQRGVGSSTNGAGAFGGSLNIQTTTRNDTAYAQLDNTAGSFGTIKNTIRVGTGLIDDKFTFDGRISRIRSDGFVDRGSSKLNSYFVSGAYYGKNNLLRANVIIGDEKTFQVWNGVPEAKLRGDNEALLNHYYNNLGYLYNTPADSLNLFNSDKRKSSQFLYDDQTDNYKQDHYQLLYTHTFSDKLNANAALHYTYGRGYYEEFKYAQKFSNYGLETVTLGNETLTRTDLIRRRWLDNDFYGMTYSLNYTPQSNLDFTLGGAYNEYDGDHFGEIIWAQYASNSNIRDKYYKGNGFKTDFNTFGKVSYRISNLSLFADLQYRHISYKLSGTDKNRDIIDQNDNQNFFNPKAGLTYQLNNSSNIYASFAVANKEPNRDDYVNSTEATRPTHETLQNVELGYRLNTNAVAVGINAYGMFYKDQLVLTGRINDVGEPVRQNVDRSYRMGLEVDGRFQVNNRFTWNITAALSENKIRNFTEVVPTYDANYDLSGQLENTFKDKNIAYSPSFIASSELEYKPFTNTEVTFISKYVDKQYLDNTQNESRKLDAFFVNDLRLRYNTNYKSLKKIGLALLVNNVFNLQYESNGYSYSSIFDTSLITENFYFPQAGTNFMLALSLKF